MILAYLLWRIVRAFIRSPAFDWLEDLARG